MPKYGVRLQFFMDDDWDSTPTSGSVGRKFHKRAYNGFVRRLARGEVDSQLRDSDPYRHRPRRNQAARERARNDSWRRIVGYNFTRRQPLPEGHPGGELMRLWEGRAEK